jgi:hypothetical protein
MRRSRLIRGGAKSHTTRLAKSDGSFSAVTILEQLGGNRFIAMTGAKDFIKDEVNRMIGFKIGRNSKSINYVRITLNGKDLYDMEFLRKRKLDLKVVSKANDVYFDQLQDVFTENTGMYTHF